MSQWSRGCCVSGWEPCNWTDPLGSRDYSFRRC